MKNIILLALLVFVPQITNASVYISEIMYDLEGTDSDREWVEIHNDTDQILDLSTYYLYENDVAHKIIGSDTVGSGEFAVIVDSVEKFLLDYPGFTGKVFDSVFSLNNSGEQLTLLDSDKNEVNTASYDPSLGAEGTGNSLQYLDGVFVPGIPTPGDINVTEPVDEGAVDNLGEDSGGGSVDSGSTHSGQNQISDYKPKIKVKTGIGRDRFVTVNTPIEFEIYKSEDGSGKHFWNFGDNHKGSGEEVKHIYKNPGEYNLVLNSYFDDYKTTSRIKVIVDRPSVEIIEHQNLIELKNIGNKELNLGEFEIYTEKEEIKILKDTIVSKGQSVFFEAEQGFKKVILRYPNGKQCYSNSGKRAEKFCQKANSLGLSCKVEKIEEIFDKM